MLNGTGQNKLWTRRRFRFGLSLSAQMSTGSTQPQSLLAAIAEDVEPLLDLVDQHVVSIQSFRPQTLLQVFRLAAKFESNPERYMPHNMPLQGKILINAFYEPSTRTRLSFDSAWHRLGGSSINITDRATTGIAKGESLEEDGAHVQQLRRLRGAAGQRSRRGLCHVANPSDSDHQCWEWDR